MSEDEDQRRPDVGRLSVVATPIGNLEDITLRGLARLREADLVLAEDTRRTRKLLTHHDIHSKLRALHAHSNDATIERCLADLQSGMRLALVSDAGTPLISDPGASLIERAVERGLVVETIPGPTAVAAALAVCGLPFDSFRFAGFAPRSGSRRRRWLLEITRSQEASVFFEAPGRLRATLEELSTDLPETRQLAVCRELTKLHEEVVRGNASELAAHFAEGARGEITVVVGAGDVAPEREESAAPDVEALLREQLATGLSARDAARSVAEITGQPRRRVYALAQSLSDRGDPRDRAVDAAGGRRPGPPESPGTDGGRDD